MSYQSLVLYHHTSPDYATKILISQKMLRGSGGSFGGGIYFAFSPQQTNGKAHNKGVILECIVKVKNPKLINGKGQLKNYTYAILQKEGHDAVHAKCFQTGDEFIVYNYGHVKHIKVHSTSVPFNHPKITCEFGDNCYRTTPEHIRDFHKSGFNPKLHPKKAGYQNIQFMMQNLSLGSCEHGNNCYRTNPDHIKNCHPPGFRPASKPYQSNPSFNNFTPTSSKGYLQYPSQQNSQAQSLYDSGNNCYQQNPDHIKNYRPSGLRPATSPQQSGCYGSNSYPNNSNCINNNHLQGYIFTPKKQELGCHSANYHCANCNDTKNYYVQECQSTPKSHGSCQCCDKIYQNSFDHIHNCHGQGSKSSTKPQELDYYGDNCCQVNQGQLKINHIHVHTPTKKSPKTDQDIDSFYHNNPDHKNGWSQDHTPVMKLQETCEYGDNCYRTNSDHIKNFHPPGFKPASKPYQSNPSYINYIPTYSHEYSQYPNQQTLNFKGSCEHGNNCYRQNPDHIRNCHPAGFVPARKS